MSAPGDRKTIRILMVDDDPIVLKIYEKELRSKGYQVEQATDGLAAMKALRLAKPDLLVLDLMMPKMSGVDVLKFIRSQPGLNQLPVIVLSNAYMDDLAREAATAGAQKALLKASCTPSQLAAKVEEVLQGQLAGDESSILLAAPDAAPAKAPPAPPEPRPQASPPVSPPPVAKSDFARGAPAQPFRIPSEPASASPNIRKEFLDHGQATCAELRALFQTLANARNDAERTLRLQSFYQRIHFVTANAGLAECPQIARMAAAVEAFIFEMSGKRSNLNASSLRTLALTIDFLGQLFANANTPNAAAPWAPQALVVDDDGLSNRLVLSALRIAQISGASFEDPRAALEWLKNHKCDLALLDIEMPGMNGFELCNRLRALPNHKHTPVVYVTSHDDFDHRAKSALTGGDDLIGKPVLPLELAVKAVMHVLKRQMAASPSPAPGA